MRRTKLPNVPVTLTHDMERTIRRAAKETGLSKADVLRTSIRLGLPLFMQKFPRPECARVGGK